MEVYKCSICDMKFRSIIDLTGRMRLEHHEDIDHLAACEICGKAFVSHSHATIHLYQCHNVRCIQCGQVCNGKCLVDIVMNSENADSDVRKKMLNEVENQIKKVGYQGSSFILSINLSFSLLHLQSINFAFK